MTPSCVRCLCANDGAQRPFRRYDLEAAVRLLDQVTLTLAVACATEEWDLHQRDEGFLLRLARLAHLKPRHLD